MLLREPRTLDCDCDCHDGVSLHEFVPCCADCGRPRVTYPDRPPPHPTSPFVWRWSDIDRKQECPTRPLN